MKYALMLVIVMGFCMAVYASLPTALQKAIFEAHVETMQWHAMK